MKVKYGSRTVNAFVVYPEVSHKAPVVLLIHEIFGLSDWARSQADDIAAMGYIVIAPDLLSGFGPNGGGTSAFPDQQSVIKAVSSLDPTTVTADLNATADYALNSHPLTASSPSSASAGAEAILPLRDRRKASATPSSSTAHRRPPRASRHHRSRLRLLRRQRRAHLATVPDTKTAMAAAGKKYDPVIYDGAGHGFMRAGEDPVTPTPQTLPPARKQSRACRRCSGRNVEAA